MEKKFTCNPNELTQARITFGVYAASVPIIIFLYLLPMIRSGQFEFGIVSIAYIAIIGFLVFQTYRTYRVLAATKKSYCLIRDDRIVGVSTPNPFEKAKSFDIARSEVLGIGTTTVPVGGMRAYNALVLNTKNHKYTLFAIDRIDELKKELQ